MRGLFLWVCIFHDGRSLSRISAQQISKFLYSGLDRVKVIHLSLEQISTDQELREPWEAFLGVHCIGIHLLSYSLSIFVLGDEKPPASSNSAWLSGEPPPAHPTATGVWSEFKGRCCDPHRQHKLFLQTDISTAREGKEGNNPSQASHHLNIMNLKLPATAREASSRSSHYSTPPPLWWCYHLWFCHCPFPCGSLLICNHQLTKLCQFPGQRSDGRSKQVSSLVRYIWDAHVFGLPKLKAD